MYKSLEADAVPPPWPSSFLSEKKSISSMTTFPLSLTSSAAAAQARFRGKWMVEGGGDVVESMDESRGGGLCVVLGSNESPLGHARFVF